MLDEGMGEESKFSNSRAIIDETTMKKYINIIENFKTSNKKTSEHYYLFNRYIVKKGNLYNKKNGMRVIPLGKVFDEISQSHGSTGHGGEKRTFHDLKFRGIANITLKHVNLFISTCKICLKKKTPAPSASSLGVVNPIISNHYGERGQVDLIDMSSFKTTQHRYILNYQDHCTKYCVLRPLINKDVNSVVKELVDIFSTLGCPKILQSDNGLEFRFDAELKKIWPELQISHGRPRHPQSQGSVERANQDVEQIMRCWLADNNTTDWVSGLPFIQMQKNNALNRTIGFSPFFAVFGRNMTINGGENSCRDEEEEEEVVDDDLEIESIKDGCNDGKEKKTPAEGEVNKKDVFPIVQFDVNFVPAKEKLTGNDGKHFALDSNNNNVNDAAMDVDVDIDEQLLAGNDEGEIVVEVEEESSLTDRGIVLCVECKDGVDIDSDHSTVIWSFDVVKDEKEKEKIQTGGENVGKPDDGHQEWIKEKKIQPNNDTVLITNDNAEMEIMGGRNLIIDDDCDKEKDDNDEMVIDHRETTSGGGDDKNVDNGAIIDNVARLERLRSKVSANIKKEARRFVENNNNNNRAGEDIVLKPDAIVTVKIPKWDKQHKLNFDNLICRVVEYFPDINKYKLASIESGIVIKNLFSPRSVKECKNYTPNIVVDKDEASHKGRLELPLRSVVMKEQALFAGCRCISICKSLKCPCRKANKKCVNGLCHVNKKMTKCVNK